MKPTLEEVKAYFKNAKEVRCLSRGILIPTSKMENDLGIHYQLGIYWFNYFEYGIKRNCKLWSEQFGYAEIISYKEPQFEYLEEVEVSDDGKVWKGIKQSIKYLCDLPDGQFACWTDGLTYWKYIRKPNHERTQAIEAIKELMTKHEIKRTEL